MSNYLIGLLACLAFLAVILVALWHIPTGDDLTEQQQAMTAEWHTFLDSLPVLKEDPR